MGTIRKISKLKPNFLKKRKNSSSFQILKTRDKVLLTSAILSKPVELQKFLYHNTNQFDFSGYTIYNELEPNVSMLVTLRNDKVL